MVDQHRIKEIIFPLRSTSVAAEQKEHKKEKISVTWMIKGQILNSVCTKVCQGGDLNKVCLFDLKHGQCENRNKKGMHSRGTIQPKAKPCTYALSVLQPLTLLHEATHIKEPNDMHNLSNLLEFPCKSCPQNSQKRLLAMSFHGARTL